MQGSIFYLTGIISNGEALKYIGQSYHIVHDHRIEEARYVFYIIPIFLLSLLRLLHLPLSIYIFIQLFLNAISIVAFFKTAKFLFQNNFFAFIATFIFITFIPYQYWNFFIYTDSLFYSLSLLFFYAIIILDDRKRSTHFIRLLLLLLLIFTRPLGMLYIPAVGVFYIFKKRVKFW